MGVIILYFIIFLMLFFMRVILSRICHFLTVNKQLANFVIQTRMYAF